MEAQYNTSRGNLRPRGGTKRIAPSVGSHDPTVLKPIGYKIKLDKRSLL